MIGQQKAVFMIHTSSVSVAYLMELWRQQAPEAVVRNIIDDSLLAEVLANGGVTEGVRQRIAAYARLAESAGADLIFNQCSSVGEAADEAARQVKVPLVKVDSRMAEEACRLGRRIGVIATLPTTLGPTCRLIRKTAEHLQREVEIVEHLCAGAFEKLVAGDVAAHNARVLAGIRELANQVDVVVCAQGSMVALLDELGQLPVPVLTSPAMGVAAAAAALHGQA